MSVDFLYHNITQFKTETLHVEFTVVKSLKNDFYVINDTKLDIN